MSNTSNIIIVGKGPAGISAALYVARAGISATIVAKDTGALLKSDGIGNFYGLTEVIPGKELAERGVAQAKSLGVEFADGEVVNLGFGGQMLVETTGKTYKGDAVILATGASRQMPNIQDLAKFEGKGISYCAVCDGFFYKGKKVAVLGGGDFAVHEINELLPLASGVTLLTNGAEPVASVPAGVPVEKRKIAAFTGGETLGGVRFEDGGSLELDGVFMAIGVAGSGELAKKLGAATENNRIVVDEKMATTAPGLYAAGDCTGGMMQVAKAVYEGAVAGTEAVKYVRDKAKA